MKLTIAKVSKILGKSQTWVRAGIIEGWLPIGVATRNGKEIKDVHEISSKKGRINYYISLKKFREYMEN